MFKKLLTPEAAESLGFVDFVAVQRALENAFGSDPDPQHSASVTTREVG